MGENLRHGNHLALQTCPYCGTAHPYMPGVTGIHATSHIFQTSDHQDDNPRFWGCYACSTCGGVVLAEANEESDGRYYYNTIVNVLPPPRVVPKEIPELPSHYLQEAINSMSAPTASLVVCASAVDAMLKEKGYSSGSLFSRIDKAATDHVITADMAKWAHHVRLEANDQRHADRGAVRPTREDAERCLEFALALADFLFVLPARVTRGLNDVFS